MRFDDHKESCIIWESDVDDRDCDCQQEKRRRMTPDEWAEWLRFDIDAGMSTPEIEADLHAEYDSILTRCRRSGYLGLQTRMIQLRAEEWAARRAQQGIHNVRCVHGAWSSDGKCNGHDKQGRKHATVAA